MTALTDQLASPDAFLEAHFYDGGLRTKPLGLNGARPSWAPEAERVGFRDEFVLAEQDLAVELYRLLHQGRKLSWLAVYRASVDRSYGDRRNHAGVGVWLADQIIVDPHRLLKALGVLSDAVVQGGPDQLEADSAKFLSSFLPKQVADLSSVPEGLQGWAFSSPEAAQTQTYVAPPGEAGPFEWAATQVAALSWLPGPGAQHSRAVILVRATPDGAPVEGRFNPEPAERDPLPAILRQIPLAVAADRQDGDQVRGQLQNAIAAQDDLTRRLDAGRAAFETLSAQAEALEAQKNELQRQIDMSDQLKLINRVCSDLDLIKSHTSAIGPQLSGLERAMRQRAAEPRFPQSGAGFQPVGPHSPSASAGVRRWSRTDKLILAVVVVAVLAAAAALLFWGRLPR